MSTHGDHGEPEGKTQPLLFETHGATPSVSNGVSRRALLTADASSDRLEPHPYSTLLGVRSPEEFRALAESMRQSGDAGEAVLYEGKVLWDPDRYRAAHMLGLKIRTKPYRGDDPVALLCSYHCHDLHLDAGTRAVTVVDLYPWADRGRPKKLTVTVDFSPRELEPKTNEQMAALAGVGTTLISQAKEVCMVGLAGAVKGKDISFAEALRRVKLVRAAGFEDQVRSGEVDFDTAYEQAHSTPENQAGDAANKRPSRTQLIQRIEKLETENDELRQRLASSFYSETPEPREMAVTLPDISSSTSYWQRWLESKPTSSCSSCQELASECVAFDEETVRLLQILRDVGLDRWGNPVE